MDLRAVALGFSLREAPRLEHPALPRYAVLCAKLIALAWLVTGQVVYTGATLVPFFGTNILAIDLRHGLLLLQLAAILTIVCSRFVRAGCALFAAIVVLLALLDQPSFSNNRLFCAAVLGMLVLGERGALARLQCALVYACAGLDKALDADWRAGVFLQSLARELCEVGALGAFGPEPRTPLALTCALTRQLDASPLLAALLSAAVIATELAITLGYVLSWRATIALACALHGAILLVTGSTFGMFFYAGIASSLLVLNHEPRSARA